MLNHTHTGYWSVIIFKFGLSVINNYKKKIMIRKLFPVAIILLLIAPIRSFAQTENVNAEMIYKIKQEGFKNSGIDELSFWMTDYLGSRLTGSKAKKRADDWTAKKLTELGLENVQVEVVREFTRGGWDNTKTYAAMTSPYYANFSATPKAWTGSTKGAVKGEVILLQVASSEDLQKYKGKLKGKIVVMPAAAGYEVSYDPLASRYNDEQLEEMKESQLGVQRARRGNVNMDDYRRLMQVQREASAFMMEEGVAVIINGSGFFNVPRSSGANYKAGDKEPIAELNLPAEAHGRMVRLLQHDVKVEMEVEIRNEFSASRGVTNVMGEIPGTDPSLKDEIVLIGGHLDSWHAGTGAADNASGCIVMMEAMRILKSLGAEPKRTVRIALWGGEEQGLNGSRGYVEKYIKAPDSKEMMAGFDQFAAYFNMDNGTGKFRGIYTQENEMVIPIFESWLKPFEDMGCSTVTSRNTSGTDHLSFDALGLPAFQFIQDEIEYDRGYHTNMDTYERLIMADLKHNAVVVAAMVYQASMRDEVLPRKPQIESLMNAGRRF